MSFILDALKKSESDRQRKNRPESAHIPTRYAESRSSRWLLIVGALLIANVFVLAYFILRPAPAVDESDIENESATAIVVEAPPAQPATFQDRVASAKRNQPPPETTDFETTPPADTVTTQETTPIQTAPDIPASAPSTSTIAYKTFNDVRLDGSVSLPDLHLDIHVFSGTPNERFVFVNMNKYKEKATLSEGPLVTEIVPEGVILEYLGSRFLLPRE